MYGKGGSQPGHEPGTVNTRTKNLNTEPVSGIDQKDYVKSLQATIDRVSEIRNIARKSTPHHPPGERFVHF